MLLQCRNRFGVGRITFIFYVCRDYVMYRAVARGSGSDGVVKAMAALLNQPPRLAVRHQKDLWPTPEVVRISASLFGVIAAGHRGGNTPDQTTGGSWATWQ